MTVRMPPRRLPQSHDPGEGLGFSGADCEFALPAGATRVDDRRAGAAAAQGGAHAHRGAWRHRMPHVSNLRTLPVLRRPRAVAVRAHRQRRRRDGARSRHPRRRLSLSRERLRAGHPGCAGSPWGYGFDAWQADFFSPARQLLAAAPWIVVRGNHESCNRAGQGWWRFLDPRPVAPRQNCNLAADDDIGNYSAPYAVPLGRSRHAVPRVRFVVGRRDADPADRPHVPQLPRAVRAGVRARRAHAARVLHEPSSGAGLRGEPAATRSLRFPATAACNRCWRRCIPARCSRRPRSAAVRPQPPARGREFRDRHPPQFITGNGGDWPTSRFPSVSAGASRRPARSSQIVSTTRFGFMTMEREGGWSMRAVGRDGSRSRRARSPRGARRSRSQALTPAASAPN